MKRLHVVLLLYAIGLGLVLLSWLALIPREVGWLGFAIGLAGSLLRWTLPKHRNKFPGTDESPDNGGLPPAE